MAEADNSLDQLKKYCIVVADTGDFKQLEKFRPQDTTTNPSLLYAASQLPQYQSLVEDAIQYGKAHGSDLNSQTEKALDKLAVNFGAEILKLIPGRVSTELDARLSFDVEGNVRKGREIIALYKELGVDKDRILLKIASTWEGLQAAKILEEEGLHVNMTLMFSLAQAAVAAENKVTLISPFAGRITDYFKEKEKRDFLPSEDPGVLSVKNIYNYLKKFGYPTVVMGASFRTKEQIIELAGCDLLTVSPSLLDQLQNSHVPVVRKLDPSTAAEASSYTEPLRYDEKGFRWAMLEDEMAHFKLAEGIRKFTADLLKVEEVIKKKLVSA